MAKKKKKNKSGAVQQLAPPSADQAAAAAAAAQASQVVVETPEDVGTEEYAAEDYPEETYAEGEVGEVDGTGEESAESGTADASQRGAFRGRGRGFMRGGRFIPPHMMRGMVPFHPAMMRGRPGFRPPPPHMMRGMFRPRGPFPPGFRPPRMRPGFRAPWPMPPRGRGGFPHGAPHGEYSEEGYEDEDEEGEEESPTDSSGVATTHSRSAPTTPSQPRKFEPRAQQNRGTFPPRGGQFRPRGQFPGQRPNFQRHSTPRFSAVGSTPGTQSYTPRPRHPPPSTHHPPPHIPSSTLTSLPPPGLPPPTGLPPPVHPHSLPPPTNQPPPGIIQQPPFGVPGMPPPMSGPPPLGQPPPSLRLTSPAPGQVILSSGHPTLLPHLHTSTAGGLAHHSYTAGVHQPPPGLPPPSHLIQPTLTLLGHQQPQLATLQPPAASYASVAAAGGQHLLAAPPPIVPTGHQPPSQLQVAPPPVVSVGGAIPSHYPSLVPGAPGGVLPPTSAAAGALALPPHVPVSAVGSAVATDRTSSRGSSLNPPPGAGSSSGQKSGSVRSVSPTAKEALKFIYSCKTTDQMSALPTCIFCSEPQTSMNDHLYSRHWHKLFVCLVVRSTGNRCKHAFVYVNELIDHITEFHGINDVDVNKFVADNHIQLPENLKLFICKLCPSGKTGIHLEHKELIYNHINKKHPEVKCTYDNIIRFECRACHKFDFQNYENLLSHIERRHSSRQVTADSRGSSSASGSRSSSSYYHEHASGAGGGASSGSSSRGYEEHRSRRDDYQDYDRSRKRRYEDDRGSDERYKQPRSDRDYSDHRRSGGSSSASAAGHHESSSSRYQDRGRDDYRRSQPPPAAVDQRHHHAAAASSHHHHPPAHHQDVSGKSVVAAAPAAAVAAAEPISDTLDLDEAFLVRTQRKDGVGGGRRHNATDGDGIVILK